MDNIYSTINKIKEAIFCDIRSTDHFSDFRPSKEDVRWGSMDNKPILTKPSVHPKHRIRILTRNFGPIPASKKRRGIYMLAYVYPKKIPDKNKSKQKGQDLFEPDTSTVVPLAVNDPDIKDQLPELLAYEASNLYSQYRKTSTILISGERGVGKTAFLNNLFSTNFHTFDKHNIIWIRLDLNIPDAIDYPLLTLLKSKGYEVLINNYIGGGNLPKKSQYFNDKDYSLAMDCYNKHKKELSIDNLISWLDTADIRNEYGSIIDLSEFKKPDFNFFSQGMTHKDKALRFSVYSEFVKDLKKPYTFIFVIDGLDESTIPLIKYEALKKWQGPIKDILKGRNCPQGLYLLCAREESFMDFVDHMKDAVVPYELRNWIVLPTGFDNIIKKRIELFKERIKKKDKDERIDYWEGDSGEYIVTKTIKCIEYAFKDIGITEDLLKVFSRLGHMRALMKFFQDAIWETVAILDEAYTEQAIDLWLPAIAKINEGRPDITQFIEDFLKRKSYRIWHIASLNYLSNYEKATEFLETGLAPPTRSAEFPFIPIIWGDLELPSENGYFNNHLLVKIRIMQCMINQFQNKAKVFNLVNTISNMLQFSPKNLKIIIKEMILQRLLNFDKGQDYFIPFEEAMIVVSGIGKRVLQVWLEIPEYIEYTMQMSTIPRTVQADFNRFFIARFKGPASDIDGISVTKYLPKLFRTMAKFTSLIDSIEKWETTRINLFKNDMKEKEVESKLKCKHTLLAGLLKEKICETVDRIITAASDDLQNTNNKEILRKLGKEYGVSFEY